MKYYRFDNSQPVDFYAAGKSMLDEEWMHYERAIDHFILYVIVSGVFYLQVDGDRKVFLPGDVFIMQPNAHHIGYQPAAVTFYWVHFYWKDFKILDLPHSVDTESNLLFPCQFHVSQMENFLILTNQLIHSSKTAAGSRYNDFLATAVLLELQSHLTILSSSPIEQPNRRFGEVLAYIEGNYRDSLQVSEVAEQFGYNEKYLSHLFRKYTGTTTIEFIQNTRLKMAEALLLNTSDTISLVSQKSGFKNEYYFMRLFKQKYGITPSQYRNTYCMQVMTKY